jgi:cytochrome c oxidase subunit 2
MTWFGLRISNPGEGRRVRPVIFYTWVGFLIIVGVSLHIVTYNTIPWAPLDLNRAEIKADKVFDISVENHEFTLPAEKLVIKCHDKVLFNVRSNDLTYGFGLFRSDNTMVFQMQVIPGHNNDILWQFDKCDIFSIRSTEYSGPEGVNMTVKDAVEVIGCETVSIK